MGDFNQMVVLEAIRRSEAGLSRVELVGVTGLSAQTVSNICRRLIGEGVIVEAGKEAGEIGKPRTILELNPSSRYAIGVHLDPVEMTFVLLNILGQTVAQSRKRTPAATDPNRVISTIAGGIERLIVGSGVDRGRIAGIGVASPGPLDAENGTVITPPQLLGWHKVPVRQALRVATGLPVLLDKDTTAAAVAEMWAGGSSGSGSFVFFYLGSGLGAGLVLENEVVRGSSSNAGEIGHIVVDPAGPPCTCGLRGCMGVTCMPENLVAEAEIHGVLTDTRLGSDPRTVDARMSDLCALAKGGHPGAREILERSGARLAVGISVMTNLLDVDHVVMGGPYWSRLSEFYLPSIAQIVGERSVARAVHKVPIVGTGVGEDVAAIGAACLVLHETFSPRADALMLRP